MKKILLFAASAVLILNGCTKNEIAVSTENSREISFAAYSGREATKAGTTTDLQTGSFQVTATYKKGDAAATSYFTNEKYTWSTDKFVSAGETHYWPVDGGKLTFFATMPENNVTDATKKITPGATVDFNTDGRTDFMAAYLADQSGPSAQLAFNHKLTKVSFAAKGQDTGLKYVVKSITLTADSTATYTMGATGSWGTASNSKNFAVLTADSTIAKGTATYKNLGASQLVIPSSGDAVSLNVKYQVYDGTSLVDDYSADGVTVDLSASAAGWGINKSFRYCLTLGLSSSVTPITFSAEQTDWGADTNKDVDVLEAYHVMEGNWEQSSNPATKVDWGGGITPYFMVGTSQYVTIWDGLQTKNNGNMGLIMDKSFTPPTLDNPRNILYYVDCSPRFVFSGNLTVNGDNNDDILFFVTPKTDTAIFCTTNASTVRTLTANNFEYAIVNTGKLKLETLTVNGNVAVMTNVNTDNKGYISSSDASLTVTSGTINGNISSIGSNSKIYINGGNITGNIYSIGGESKVEITSGNIKGQLITKDSGSFEISGGMFSTRPDDNFIKTGYEVVDNTDTTTKDDYPYLVKTALIVF